MNPPLDVVVARFRNLVRMFVGWVLLACVLSLCPRVLQAQPRPRGSRAPQAQLRAGEAERAKLSSVQGKADASLSPLPKNALVALLPVRGGSVRMGQESGGEAARQAKGLQQRVERELVTMLKKLGYRVVMPNTTRARLRGHRAAAPCTKGMGRCDYRGLLRPLRVSAVVSAALWAKDGVPVEVFVRVTRRDAEGSLAQPVADAAGLLPATDAAVVAALRRAAGPASPRVRIESRPSHATVTVDRQQQLQTPVELSLAPGKHLLVVSHRGYVTRSVFMDVPEGSTEPTVQRVSLARDPAMTGEEPQPASPQLALRQAPERRAAGQPSPPEEEVAERDSLSMPEVIVPELTEATPAPMPVDDSEQVAEVSGPQDGLEEDAVVVHEAPEPALPPVAGLTPPVFPEPQPALDTDGEPTAWDRHWPDYLIGGVLGVSALALFVGAISTAVGDGDCVEEDPATGRCVAVQEGQQMPMLLGAAGLGLASGAMIALTPLSDLSAGHAGVQWRIRF